jgi:hypothetical protein
MDVYASDAYGPQRRKILEGRARDGEEETVELQLKKTKEEWN